MRICFIVALFLISFNSFSQQEKEKKTRSKEVGIKLGVNFPDIQNTSDINSRTRNGFMIGGYFSPKSKGVLGFRSELVFSRIGYGFTSTTSSGEIGFDYLLLPFLSTVNITKFVLLQFGPQFILMLNAKGDSTTSVSRPGTQYKLMNFYNRFDYGIAGGVEVYPFKGLIAGARYNFSFGTLQKENVNTTGFPSGVSGINTKTSVLQFFLGWKF